MPDCDAYQFFNENTGFVLTLMCHRCSAGAGVQCSLCIPLDTGEQHPKDWLRERKEKMDQNKMTQKGRSPNMRHVQRTSRVDLDWMFERLYKDKASQLRHVGNKKQISDMFTK